MIEFLPPRNGAFGETEVADFAGFDGFDADDVEAFDQEPPRSRWLTALAVVGVTGLLAGGVIAAAPWDGEDVAAPPTTTVPTTASTTPLGSTAAAKPRLPPGVSADVPGMLPTGPSPFLLVRAASGVDQRQSGDDDGDPVEVWMSPEASRNTGRWIVIDSHERSRDPNASLRRDAIRVDAGTRPALVVARPDGIVEIEVHADESAAFAIAGFGVGLSELIRIASIVRIDAQGIDHGDLLTPGGPFDGLDQRVADDVAWSAGGLFDWTADAVSGFVDPTSNRSIQISVAAAVPARQLLDELIGTVPVDPATLSLEGLEGLFSLSARFDSVTVLRSARDAGIGFVRFALADRRIVTVAGQIEVDDLLAFAAQVELAAPETWEAAVIDATNGEGIRSGAETTSAPIGGSSIGQWQAEVYGTPDPVQVTMYGPNVYMSESFEPDAGPHLTMYRSIGEAFILATNTWPNEGRRVVISQPGLEPQDLALLPVPASSIHALMVRLDATLPYEVQWLDRWGAPVGEATQAVP